MTTGTGPQALTTHLQTNWTPSRTGREDIPDIIRDPDGNPSSDPDDASEPGRVIITEDREKIANQHSVFDLVHCYHPQAGLSITDRGYNEQNEVETVQIDIEVEDRTDPTTGERLSARDRLVGDRNSSNFPSDESAPYPGVSGEVQYILETARRGLGEWDVASADVVNIYLGNSNASISWSVDLEHIAKNTV